MLTVLTHLTGTDCDPAVLTTALALAKPLDGHMKCLRVELTRAALVGQAMPALEFGMGVTTLLGDLIDAAEQEGAERTKRARQVVSELCKMEDVPFTDAPPGPGHASVEWRHQMVSYDSGYLKYVTRFHDVLVLAGGKERAGRFAPGILGDIIVACGRPVVLAPEKPRHAGMKRIAVAWKDSPESARALTAVMPLLRLADRVDIITISESDEKAMECVDCGDELLDQLKWHGILASRHFVLPAGRTTTTALLETAHKVEADLLVMGAYSHSRAHESVFGGVTKEILKGVDLPVLLLH